MFNQIADMDRRSKLQLPENFRDTDQMIAEKKPHYEFFISLRNFKKIKIKQFYKFTAYK